MKKSRKRGTREKATARGKTYVFLLFVAGHETNSLQARNNLARLCEEHLKGRSKSTIVDVLKDAAVAHTHNVLLTPTLILIAPLPKVVLLGNLRDTKQVLASLRLVGTGP